MNGMASFTLGGPRTTLIFNGLFESLNKWVMNKICSYHIIFILIFVH